MPRNRSEKVPQLPEGINPALKAVIVADCWGHLRDERDSAWVLTASQSNLGHPNGQSAFGDLSQLHKNAWDCPEVRAYMAVYLDFLYATQSK